MWKGSINMESFAKIYLFIYFLSLWITRALHESWMHKPLSTFTKEGNSIWVRSQWPFTKGIYFGICIEMHCQETKLASHEIIWDWAKVEMSSDNWENIREQPWVLIRRVWYTIDTKALHKCGKFQTFPLPSPPYQPLSSPNIPLAW